MARWFDGIREQAGDFTVEWTAVNGRPSALLYVDGQFDTVATIVVEDGRVDAIYLVRNPAKLDHLAEPRTLTRS